MDFIKGLIKLDEELLEIEIYGTGQPIIFFTGLYNHLSEFREISMKLKEKYQCILFSRPGLGKSTISSNDLNVTHTCEIVYDMLNKQLINDKLILVGHSHGGLCVQRFVQMYTERVKGILLIDSTSVDENLLDELDTPELNKGTTKEDFIRYCKKMKELNREEIRKEIDLSEYDDELVSFYTSPNLYRAMFYEISNWKKDTKLIKKNFKQVDIPLVVLGRDKKYCITELVKQNIPYKEADLFESTWHKLIENQGLISQTSKVKFISNTNHNIHLCSPEAIIQNIISLERDN
ncbi:alpha/beta fold hydrolase [Mammaliicoccus lentus]|uniref:alpha/beta fold hydrolase n=1 Tax=Mammaliicoccus lentus TaxID=42858 RepID=UPI00214AD274|nr:alpha/beta fold hydrolase [Mammaliicoccus lentus]